MEESSKEVVESPKFKLGRHFRSRFVSGLFVLIPLAVTLFVLKVVLSTLESAAMPFVRPLLKTAPQSVLVVMAIVFMVTVIYLIGQIASHIVGQRVIRWGEALLLRLPLIKSVYTTSKQVVEIFSTNSATAFKAVVMVTFPHPDSMAVGFVTGTMLDPTGNVLYRVFVPTTPNPTSGFLVILPLKQINFTDIPVEEGIRMIVSGGMLAPLQYKVVSAPVSVNP
ncbi:MAG TPA: hypothetical protein DCS43_02830 [Verrucomicrobia bacterium]|nr:hypothetical protein [Verrucomicrobiota bacterium]